jgi:ribosomal protein L27
MNKKFIKITKYKAYWSNKKTVSSTASSIDEHSLTLLIDWLIDNTYVEVGNIILRQTIGIPMGTDCAHT